MKIYACYVIIQWAFKKFNSLILKLSIHSCICKSEESLIQSHSELFQVLLISTSMINLMQGKDCLKNVHITTNMVIVIGKKHPQTNLTFPIANKKNQKQYIEHNLLYFHIDNVDPRTNH